MQNDTSNTNLKITKIDNFELENQSKSMFAALGPINGG